MFVYILIQVFKDQNEHVKEKHILNHAVNKIRPKYEKMKDILNRRTCIGTNHKTIEKGEYYPYRKVRITKKVRPNIPLEQTVQKFGKVLVRYINTYNKERIQYPIGTPKIRMRRQLMAKNKSWIW